MATTTSSSKDRLFHARRKSLGRDDLLLSKPVNRTTAISSPGESPIRRRRISQGGGWAKGRDRSSSQPRPVAVCSFLKRYWGIVQKCFSFVRLAIRNYIWPIFVWPLTLVFAIFVLGVFIRICEMLAEPVAGMAGELACSVSPKAVPDWLSAVPGPFHGIEPCAIPPQSAAEAILDDPAAAKTLINSPWLVSEVAKVEKSHYDYDQWIGHAENAAMEIRSRMELQEWFEESYAADGKVYSGSENGLPSPRAVEIAAIVTEWSKLHDESWDLVRSFIWSDKLFRHDLESKVGRVRREIREYEAEGSEASRCLSLAAEWIPGVFQETRLGRIVRECDELARELALEANSIAEKSSEILRALALERSVVNDLKVVLPVNLGELNVEYDLGPLQTYLQYEFEGWMQGALILAVRFQKEKEQLRKQFTDISAALRRASWDRQTRVELKEAITGNLEGIKMYLEEFQEYLKAEWSEANGLSKRKVIDP